MNNIAVLLPVYKKDKVDYLSKSVESILYQTYKDFHLYIGVDGPVGADLGDSLKLLERQDKISVMWYPENRGLASVLNDLLTDCFKEGYEYIARMDADDISVLDRFEKQMHFLEQHPDVDVVGGFASGIDENGKLRNVITRHPENPEECRKIFAYTNPLGHPAVLFRKRFFDKAGLYRPEYRTNQDTLLWYDGLRNGVQMGNVQDVVIYFRTTSDMLKNRRGGFKKAKKQLTDRRMINHGLGYGIKANIYAYGIFLMMISPYFVRKLAYDILKR